MIIAVLYTMGSDMMRTFRDLTSEWRVAQAADIDRADTAFTTHASSTVHATSSWVDLVFTNTGQRELRDFDQWDLTMEVQTSTGLGIEHLVYTSSTTPLAGEWALGGVYLDATTQTTEIVNPGTIDSGEAALIRAKPVADLTAGDYNRATATTPNGVTSAVIFEVVP